MVDLESIVNKLPVDQFKLLTALKILVDSGLIKAITRANGNQLVDARMDSEDEAAIAKEVRDVRQTNRVLLGFEESARELTKGLSDE